MSELRWHTQACIGRGSSSTVHRARLLPSGRLVAVKRVHAPDVRYLRRLRQEAELLRGLKHENIVELIGVREDRRGLSLVAVLVDGCTVAQLLDSLAPAPQVVLYIARALFEALAYAHDQGVVHRDISPRNVLLSWDGEVKLTDFGLAKRSGCPPTTAGALRGTVPYVSPEQLQGGVADHRSDLFAAGVLLYELIAGRLPFEGDVMQCVAMIVRGAPIPRLREASPWVSSELEAVVMKLMASDVDERYQCAGDVLADLPEVADGQEELIAVMDALRGSEPRKAGLLRQIVVAAAILFGSGAGLSANSNGQAPASDDKTTMKPDVVESVVRERLVIPEQQPDVNASDSSASLTTERSEQAVPATSTPTTPATNPTRTADRVQGKKARARSRSERHVYTQKPSRRRVFSQEPSSKRSKRGKP